MNRESDDMKTPVNARPPTEEEVEQDRLRREKERAWARAAEEGQATRAKAQTKAARERAEAQAAAESARALGLAQARQAEADAKGTVLHPTGAARQAMIRSQVLAVVGILVAVLLLALGAFVFSAGSTVVGFVVAAIGVVAGVACTLAAWYWWWVGVVGFLADKVGDAVAKRMDQVRPPR